MIQLPLNFQKSYSLTLLSAELTKWLNTIKQTVFGHFVEWRLKG